MRIISQALQFINEIIRVAIYARLSDEDKNKLNSFDASESIKNQISLAMEYAKKRGWVVVAVYSDDDYSGLYKDRPDFQKLLKDCEAGEIDVVICKDMSRFSRDSIVTEEYLENKFVEWGVRFIGLSDGSDTADKANKKARQINSLVNMWYAEDISNKVKGAFEIKRLQGDFIGSYATYGYEKSVEDKNMLVIDEEASRIVKKIFQLYLEGNGTQQITNILNEEGIPNPTLYKEQKGLSYKNPFKKDNCGLWNKTTVKRILKNETYIGNMVQGKIEKIHFKTKKRRNLAKNEWIVVEGTHEPIIEKETLLKVQQMLESKIRSTGLGTPHLFAGKLVCKDCGSPLTKTQSAKNAYFYLSCSQYRKDKNSCTRHSVRLDILKEAVEDNIRKHINKFLHDKDEFIEMLVSNENSINDTTYLQEKAAEINDKISEIMQALKNIYLDKGKKQIDDEIFNELRTALLEEKRKKEIELEKVTKKIEASNSVNDNHKYWADTLEKFAGFLELDRFMVMELIDYIEIGEKTNGNQDIVIHYNFKKL